MPSFKSCFASLIVVAFAMTPIVSAYSPVAVANDVAKRALDNSAGRIVSRSDKVQAVKRARKQKIKVPKVAAVQAGRQKPTPAQQSAATAIDPYAADGIFLNSILATSAALRRCGVDATCRTSLTIPENATAFCVANRCTFRCNSPAFAPSGTQCALAPNSCPNQSPCPTVSGGFVGCNPQGTCTATCPANQGFTLVVNQSNTAFVCLNFSVDENNCGTVGNVCGPSYNGLGSPKCKSGVCSLVCPAGLSVRETTGGDRFCA